MSHASENWPNEIALKHYSRGGILTVRGRLGFALVQRPLVVERRQLAPRKGIGREMAPKAAAPPPFALLRPTAPLLQQNPPKADN